MSRRPRRRAWGSVTSKGRDVHVIRWVEDSPEGRKRRSRTIHGSYSEACAALDRIHAALGDSAPSQTLGEVARAWWEPSLDAKSPRTREMYLRSWRLHCAPTWDACPADAVHPAAVQGWLSGLPRGEGRIALVVMRAVGDLAVRYEACEVNKFALHYELGAATCSRGSEVPDPQALADMWGMVRGTRLEAPYILAAYGGLRTGESLAVGVADVERVELCGVVCALINVDKQMPERGTKPVHRLKTPQSVRTAVVVGAPAERLLEIRSERVADGSEWMADRRDGLPLAHTPLNAQLRRIGFPAPWASLRKGWRTMAQFAWGVDWDTCELLMGHKLPGVSGAHYIAPDALTLAARVAEKYATWDK